MTTVALALIFAGALGNVHDRIAYGSVVDFIEVHIYTYHWPDFNVADSSIVIGACLLMLDSLLPKNRDQGSGSQGSGKRFLRRLAFHAPLCVRSPSHLLAPGGYNRRDQSSSNRERTKCLQQDSGSNSRRIPFRKCRVAGSHDAPALDHLRAAVFCHGDCLR